MIRTLITAIFLLFYFLISLPMYALIPLVAKVDQNRADRMAQGSVCWALRIVLKLSGSSVDVSGNELIPQNEPVVYIANHQSYFDIVSTYPYVVGIVGYIAKNEINAVPLFGWWMPLLHGLTFDREDPRSGINMIRTAIDQIRSGYSMFVFPEGTRTKDGSLGEFKTGSFKLVTRTGVAIVPVAIKGTSAIFEDHIPVLKPSDVKISFGKPIRINDLEAEDRKHIAVYVRNVVEEMLEKL